MMLQRTDRRAYERFATAPMYTTISVRLLSETGYSRHGHVYDISEGGVRFELDEPIDSGTEVAARITLPASASIVTHPGAARAIVLTGNVVWSDVSEPGPAQMAIAITSFARSEDRRGLLEAFRTGSLRRVA